MATLLITGGTGLIGQALTKELLLKGYEVIILSRDPNKGKQTTGKVSYAAWNLAKQTIDEKAIQKADYIVHLAGANVGSRWTEKRKKEIMEREILRKEKANKGMLIVLKTIFLPVQFI